ncbi:MAG TPA: hypothetical protein VD926_03540 [Acidimicrobiales bacterium]|nr:hypothetical protein [Acidimicrobiales bacterium]
MAPDVPTDRPITREDLRAGFAGLQGEVVEKAEDAKTPLLAVGAGVLAVVVVLAFVLGKRRGKQDKTYIEIRRV